MEHDQSSVPWARAARTMTVGAGKSLLFLAALTIATPALAQPLDGASLVEARAVEVHIRQGRVVDGPAVIRLHEADQVVVRCHSDATLHLHLHGYEIEAVAHPGEPAVFNFLARAAGRFPVSVHASGQSGRERVLFYIEVHPR